MRGLILLSLILATSLQAEELLKVTIVKYQIIEADIEPYISRMMITDDQMRMDDDEDQGNYLLFSRQTGVIESVNHSEQSIFVINPKGVSAEPPFELKQKTAEIPLSDVPAIDGKIPQQFHLSVNGELCQTVVSVAGLLDGVLSAWRKFRHVLAGEHAAMLSYIPADQQQGCDLALNTFAPTWFLDFGLPIQSQEVTGKNMILVDYTIAEQVDSRLFSLPDGYQRYSAE
ncbi:MAG TPA: hypothetical protein ENH92_04755 [Ectothiorhodospiraceae bacterium]|nr:hypothetical protein [Ectothiorhodospiraceae bacterium]